AETVLNMLGQQRLAAAILVFSAVANIGLGLVLVPRFGMMGAAAATSIACVFAASMNYVVARRKLGLDLS
ncbi:polysaccharide biosynthesis C-terminal domain-containing protein, partial [Vibrio parahaemolyticus]